MHWFAWLIVLLLFAPGCVHTIHVSPHPSAPASSTIPRSVQLVTGPLLKEGADHMPGINLLRWTRDDVRNALIDYAERRETFTAVSTTPADLTMTVGVKLSLKSRDRYWYKIRLDVDMKDAAHAIGQYVAEHEVEGSWARWITASDQDPIEAALQRALDDLFAQIEGDRSSYIKSGRPSAK
jgi:hypothetical protein